MAKSRKELIGKIEAAITMLQELLTKQFANNKKIEDLNPKEKYKIFVLEEILRKANAFYAENIQKKFEELCTANEKLPDHDKAKKEKGKILVEVLRLLENEFGKLGNQQTYIDEAAKTYRKTGTNGIAVSKTDISDAENAVFICVLTCYSRLRRHHLCLEELGELGADERYANSAHALKQTMEAGVITIKPNEVKLLDKERQKFKAIFDDLVLRIQDNKNLKPYEEIPGDSPLAVLVRKINLQLFNQHGKSKLPSKTFLTSLQQEALKAAAQGDEKRLLQIKELAAAVDIWVNSIATQLNQALDEYSEAAHKKVQKLEEDFKNDLKETLASGTDILKMRYILAIADAMQSLYSEENDFALLATDAQTFASTCANLDTIPRNGWKNVGSQFATEIELLSQSLAEFIKVYRNQRPRVDSVGASYLTLQEAFVKQCEAHEEFPKELTSAVRKWKVTTVPAFFAGNWYAETARVLSSNVSSFRAFINDHKIKMSVGGIVGGVLLAAAAVALSVFVITLSWYIFVAAAVAGIILGVATGALAGKIADKCCGVTRIKQKLEVQDAGFLLGMDLPPDTSPQQSSSAKSIKQLRTDNDIELDEISASLRSIGEVNLDEVVVKPVSEVHKVRRVSDEDDLSSRKTPFSGVCAGSM